MRHTGKGNVCDGFTIIEVDDLGVFAVAGCADQMPVIRIEKEIIQIGGKKGSVLL